MTPRARAQPMRIPSYGRKPGHPEPGRNQGIVPADISTEMRMTYQDRDPRPSDGNQETGRALQPVPMQATGRQAFWSCITAIAMVFVLFVMFYTINAQRDAGTVARTSPPAAATGLAGGPSEPQTTGQGGSGNEVRPEGEGAR